MWVVVSVDEAAKMASTNQFFYLVLECFAFVCGMSIVMVVAAIFGHVCVMRVGCFTRWWDEVSLKSFIKEAGSGTFSGAYMVKHGCLGSLCLESGREGGLGVGSGGCVIIAELRVAGLHLLHADVVRSAKLKLVHGCRWV